MDFKRKELQKNKELTIAQLTDYINSTEDDFFITINLADERNENGKELRK